MSCKTKGYPTIKQSNMLHYITSYPTTQSDVLHNTKWSHTSHEIFFYCCPSGRLKQNILLYQQCSEFGAHEIPLKRENGKSYWIWSNFPVTLFNFALTVIFTFFIIFLSPNLLPSLIYLFGALASHERKHKEKIFQYFTLDL